jgi:hypothetical protein
LTEDSEVLSTAITRAITLTTQRNIPEDSHLNIGRHENLKSHLGS